MGTVLSTLEWWKAESRVGHQCVSSCECGELPIYLDTCERRILALIEVVSKVKFKRFVESEKYRSPRQMKQYCKNLDKAIDAALERLEG